MPSAKTAKKTGSKQPVKAPAKIDASNLSNLLKKLKAKVGDFGDEEADAVIGNIGERQSIFESKGMLPSEDEIDGFKSSINNVGVILGESKKLIEGLKKKAGKISDKLASKEMQSLELKSSIVNEKIEKAKNSLKTITPALVEGKQLDKVVEEKDKPMVMAYLRKIQAQEVVKAISSLNEKLNKMIETHGRKPGESGKVDKEAETSEEKADQKKEGTVLDKETEKKPKKPAKQKVTLEKTFLEAVENLSNKFVSNEERLSAIAMSIELQGRNLEGLPFDYKIGIASEIVRLNAFNWLFRERLAKFLSLINPLMPNCLLPNRADLLDLDEQMARAQGLKLMQLEMRHAQLKAKIERDEKANKGLTVEDVKATLSDLQSYKNNMAGIPEILAEIIKTATIAIGNPELEGQFQELSIEFKKVQDQIHLSNLYLQGKQADEALTQELPRFLRPIEGVWNFLLPQTGELPPV